MVSLSLWIVKRGPRVALAALVVVLALECSPTEVVALCGHGCVTKTEPSDQVTQLVTGPATFTLDDSLLLPTTNDRWGEEQEVLWSGSHPFEELIAVDGSFVLGDLLPGPYNFFSLRQSGTGKLTKKFTPQNSPTRTLVHYDHGECRVPIPWRPFFDDITNQILVHLQCLGGPTPGGGYAGCPITADAALDLSVVGAGLLCYGYDWNGQNCPAGAPGDMYQAQFSGEMANSTSGFDFVAEYTLDVAGAALDEYAVLQSVDVAVAPSYRFSVDPKTGLLAVDTIDTHVTTYNGSGAVQKAFETQLGTTLPQVLESRVAQSMTIVPPAGPAQIRCDTKTDDCFKLLTSTEDGVSGAYVLLNSILHDASKTQLAASALESRNFVCQRTSGEAADSTEGVCAFRPVIERINVMPEQFELVLAESSNDEAKVELYTALGELAAAANEPLPGGGSGLCGQPVVRAPDGPVPLITHPATLVGVPPSGFECPPCPNLN